MTPISYCIGLMMEKGEINVFLSLVVIVFLFGIYWLSIPFLPTKEEA